MSFLDDEIRFDDWLGRRVNSRKESRRAMNNRNEEGGSPNTFVLRKSESELSVDRLLQDDAGSPRYNDKLKEIATKALPPERNFYGWAALRREQIEDITGLSVHKSSTNTNPYHAHITVERSLLESGNYRDELARKAKFVECPPPTESDT